MINVFVYGTLRPLGGLFGVFEDSYAAIFKGTIRGKLLDIGSFPGLVEGDGIVHGEVITLVPECCEAILKELDYIEGVNNEFRHKGLYRREVVGVQTTYGVVQAFVYVFNHPRHTHAVIEGGDWIKYSRAKLEKNDSDNLEGRAL